MENDVNEAQSRLSVGKPPDLPSTPNDALEIARARLY